MIFSTRCNMQTLSAPRRIARSFLGLPLRPGCLLVVLLAATSVAGAQSPADRFVAGIASNDALPADAQELIRNTWAQCDDCDGDEFLTQGLTVLSLKFREALDAYDADAYGRCAAIMHDLSVDRNPFVAVNAAAYEIKSLVQMERLQEAARRLEALMADGGANLRAHSYFAPEMGFLRGYCLLADLQYGPAESALEGFLNSHPDTSQRLKIAAEQMLAELNNRVSEGIGDVSDLMTFCGRRLSHADTGEVVQVRQDRILDLLDRMIEEEEEKESSSSSSSSGGGGQNNSDGQSPSNPLQESRLPGGSAKEGPLRERRRANPAEAWGSMPPAERERILQALRDSFPSRYRKLVEQYYEELAKKP